MHAFKTKKQLTGGGALALTHTADHRDCPACNEANLQLLRLDDDFSRLSFRDAVPRWIEHRRAHARLKPRTKEAGLEYLRALERFFGSIRLCEITPGHLKAYQIARGRNELDISGHPVSPWKRTAGHSRINHELSCLTRMLRHCGLWAKLQPYYLPLATPAWSPREELILSEEDEQQLFAVAASCPDAALAYWVACITNNTSASGIELRGLRLKNLYLRPPAEISEIYIPQDACKNSSRPRKIALNRTARWAVEQCYRRALSLGSCQPEHYLFPLRLNHERRTDAQKHRDKYDPHRPASRFFLRNSWNKLREATGFHQLNPHDLRHQCITRMLENGVLPATVRAIAGHVTEQMMNYYSHIRRESKYEAVMAIELNERDRVRIGPQAVQRRA
jgi:integrase